jgi:hypothetical protein
MDRTLRWANTIRQLVGGNPALLIEIRGSFDRLTPFSERSEDETTSGGAGIGKGTFPCEIRLHLP